MDPSPWLLDSNGREYGEFEIELSQIDKEEPEPTAKLKLQLRDPALAAGSRALVTLNDQPVFETEIKNAGRVLATETRTADAVSCPAEGDICRVLVDGSVIAEAELKLD